jgi:hypothetical protein
MNTKTPIASVVLILSVGGKNPGTSPIRFEKNIKVKRNYMKKHIKEKEIKRMKIHRCL